MLYKMDYSKVIKINVFLERGSTRIHVGKLERKENKYHFAYSEKYLNYKKAIPLGHELPLTKQYFENKELFPFFLDRIPAKENPAYLEYCRQFDISLEERNAIILLATIGRRGPSWFVFEPLWGDTFSSKDLKKFRKDLDLSTRDFGTCFGISQATIVRIENNQASGVEVLKFLEVLYKFPEAAAYYVERYASSLSSKTKERVLSKLRANTWGWWGILTQAEFDFSKKAGDILRTVDWAQKMLEAPSIQQALNYSPQRNRKDEQTVKQDLFEVRFAYAIHTAGHKAEYEVKAGVKKTSIDFGIYEKDGNAPKWLMELTSIEDSQAIKENMIITNHGVKCHSNVITPWDEQNSVEVRELKKIQNAILHKVTERKKDGKIVPIKFPVIQKDNPCAHYHVIIVDTRGFDASMSDEGDYENILYGSKESPDLHKRGWIEADGTKKPFLGVFNEEFLDPRTKYLQERVHAVGFIQEKNFAENEIVQNLQLYANPRFLSTKEVRKLWPLKISSL